jgi:hypothetical protein
MAAMISSRLAETGNDSGNSIFRGETLGKGVGKIKRVKRKDELSQLPKV